MAILVQTDEGYCLDTEQYWNKTFESTSITNCTYRMKTCLHQVTSPFLMNSQFNALKDDNVSLNRKRKRLKKARMVPELSETDQMIEKITSSVVLGAKNLSIYNPVTLEDNNEKARKESLSITSDDQLRWMTESSKCPTTQLLMHAILDNAQEVTLNSAGGVLTAWPHTQHGRLNVMGQKYILPPQSEFLLSGVEQLNELAKLRQSYYNLIVLDPPWENKSVKRQKRYEILTDDNIFDLPVCRLAAPNCLLVCWVTNKLSLQETLRKTILPRWGFRHVATWYWCKVTMTGEPVTQFTNNKKPYETLLMASRGELPTTFPSETKVLVSVPSLLHSAKPPVIELIKHYIPGEKRCLELFARNLLQGFTSWGNEVLKHQNVEYFDYITPP